MLNFGNLQSNVNKFYYYTLEQMSFSRLKTISHTLDQQCFLKAKLSRFSPKKSKNRSHQNKSTEVYSKKKRYQVERNHYDKKEDRINRKMKTQSTFENTKLKGIHPKIIKHQNPSRSKKVKRNSEITFNSKEKGKHNIPAHVKSVYLNTNTKPITKKQLNSLIKKKTDDFKVLSRCLIEYSRIRSNFSEFDEREEKTRLHQMIQMIKAFNRSEIQKISPELKTLIGEIIKWVQTVTNESETYLKRSKIKNSRFVREKTFPNPYENDQDTFCQGSKKFQVSEYQDRLLQEKQIKYNKHNESTVKKHHQSQHEGYQEAFGLRKRELESQLLHYNLQKLKLQKQRLKQISKQFPTGSATKEEKKKKELEQLKFISQQNQRKLEQLQFYQ